ncbi:MAG: MgtC/SapB family protein [Planctomycetes bacterium]|nr:MgtC/SapB family protein [Planctomycetota bacterium]
MELELHILLRLWVAAILGGIVGYERGATGKRAGLRTHMLVAVGSALFMSCSDLTLDWSQGHVAAGLPSTIQVQTAMLTPVQAIATGIGFLGAGTIFLGGHRQRVHGLTTAASIWVIAAVGVVVGCDRFLLGAGASVLCLIILHVLVRFEPHPDHGAGIGSENASEEPGASVVE